MGELLGALGLAWPRVLLYPGGLFALLAAWLLLAWLRARGLRTGGAEGRGGGVVALVPPLAALTLLPLAPARSFPYGLDLVLALALLEWPRLFAWLRAPGAAIDDRTLRADVARDYLPLLAAAGLMGAGVGGLELTRLLRWPQGIADQALLAGGALLWTAALPRLLLAGPPSLAGGLRALGLTLIAALPLVGALATWTAGVLPANLAGWALPPAAIALIWLAVALAARRSTG